MPENNKQASSNKRRNYKKNRNRQNPQKKQVEVNSANQTNEFCSFGNSIALSNYFFGANIFDFYSPDALKNLVKNPMMHNDEIRKISLMLYGMNGTYTNTVDYMTSMPTLSRVVVPHGESAKNKKKNKALMESTLRVIKDKEFIRDSLFTGMIEGVSFKYFETVKRPKPRNKMMSDHDVKSIAEINELDVNVSIITLPADYTKIVGMRNNVYVLAFNLDYFDLSGGEDREKKLKKYPKEIREAYRKKNKGEGNWVVLDSNKTIVHKIRSKTSEPWGRPLVLAAINDILYGDYFTDTKRGILDDINNRIIYMTFPAGDKNSSISSLTQKQQQHQHNAVKNAVLNKNSNGGTNFFSVAANTKINSIDPVNTDLFDDKYESNLNDKIALGMGLSGALLNGVGSGSHSSQKSNLELVTSQVFQWIEQIETELNKCIAANVIKDENNYVEVKYLPITHVNKSDMVGYAKDLYLQGKGSLSLWSAACGIEPSTFFAMLDEELENDYENKYPVHMTSYIASGKSEDVGRPMDKDSQIEGTLESRESRANNE